MRTGIRHRADARSAAFAMRAALSSSGMKFWSAMRHGAGGCAGMRSVLRFARLLGVLLLALTLPLLAQGVTDPSQPTFVIPELKAGQPMRILVYGDMRFTDPSNTSDTSPRVRKWLAEKVAAEHPDAMFVTGDVPFV